MYIYIDINHKYTYIIYRPTDKNNFHVRNAPSFCFTFAGQNFLRFPSPNLQIFSHQIDAFSGPRCVYAEGVDLAKLTAQQRSLWGGTEFVSL